jgi:hypothetical protein
MVLPALLALHAFAFATANESLDQVVNPIVKENKMAGAESKFWDVNGNGDPTIQGFMTEISVDPGEDAVFKVKAPTVTAYRVDMFRLGYYGGAGARRVTTLRPSSGSHRHQPDCHFDNETLLVDCGNWFESFRWPVPTTAVSGLYIARLVREDDEEGGVLTTWRSDHSSAVESRDTYDTGAAGPCSSSSGQSAHAYGCRTRAKKTLHKGALKEPRASLVYFVVRTSSSMEADEQAADVLFQTMDSTWQAHNCWGGVDTYGVSCSKGDGAVLVVRGKRRATKVSYNRPFATRGSDPSSMPFAYEYPMVRWLERNGYHVTYWAGADADKFHDKHRVFTTNAATDAAAAASSSSSTPPPPPLSMTMTSLLDKAKVYVTVGHDEYWSHKQRSVMEAALNKGMSLAFFSASSMFWKAKWEDDHRTLVVMKETLESEETLILKQKKKKNKKQRAAAVADDDWTGTWRDGRLLSVNPQGPKPENALIGQLFTNMRTSNGEALSVPLKKYGRHRFWRHTAVARELQEMLVREEQQKKQQQQQCSNNDSDRQQRSSEDVAVSAVGVSPMSPVVTGVHHFSNLIGKQVDEDMHNNGFRPPGLMHLSSSDLEHAAYLMDEGATYDTGSATHHLTLYRHHLHNQQGENREGIRGGLVFCSGSSRWSWGLDGHHDSEENNGGFTLRVGVDSMRPDGDADIQQATVNLLGDMGVQPATPQPHLVLTQQPSNSNSVYLDNDVTDDLVPPLIGKLAGQWPHVLAGVSVIHGIATDDHHREATQDEEDGDDGGRQEGARRRGGVVAGVEVTEDGGLTWAIAELIATSAGGVFEGGWRYRLTLLAKEMARFGEVEVVVRAVVDSGNTAVETIKAVARFLPHMEHLMAA